MLGMHRGRRGFEERRSRPCARTYVKAGMRACDFAVRAKQCCVGAFWTSSMAMSRTCRQRQQQRASNRQLWSEIQHLLVRDILVDLSSFDDKCLVGEAVGEEEQAASAREPERAVEEGVGEHPTRSHPPPVAQHHLLARLRSPLLRAHVSCGEPNPASERWISLEEV